MLRWTCCLSLVLVLAFACAKEERQPPLRKPPTKAAVRATGPLTWAGCGISKKAFMVELAVAFTVETGIAINIEGGGATRGIRDTAAGKIDMGGSCRHSLPVPEEEGVKLIPVAWDALVVIAHPDSKVSDLTLDQVKGILAGRITRWAELGGEDLPIHIVTRTQGPGGKISGVGRTLRELVFFNPEMDFTDNAIPVASSGPLEERVERDRSAVGITGISSAKRRNVKILSLGSAEPSYDNISSGKYSLVRPLYLVVPSGELAPGVQSFIEFALSDEGQAVLKKSGTVTLADGEMLWVTYRKMMRTAGVEMKLYQHQ